LWLDGEGVRAAPSQTNAVTRTQTTGISTDLPRVIGRIARRIASRRVTASRQEANRIAARHAEERINREWDQAVERQLSPIATSMDLKRQKLPIDANFIIERIEYSTTPDYLQLVVSRAGASGRTRVAPPARDGERPDIEVQVHGSLVPNPLVRSQLPRLLRPAVNSLLAEGLIKELLGEQSVELATDWTWRSTPDGQWLTMAWSAPSRRALENPQIARYR
jgi:hypothetical protein